MDRRQEKKRFLIPIVLLLALLFLLTSCLAGTLIPTQDKPAGFFLGVWHGWIAPASLIIGIFDPSVRIYEVYNRGLPYDFGFYIAIISGFGGVSLVRRKSRRDR